MAAVARRAVLEAGGIGISTAILPAAVLAASPAASTPDPPGAPVSGATVAGGVVSLTLTEAPDAASHTYSLWRNRTDLTGDPTPDLTGTAPDGSVSLTIGGGSGDDAPLDETASHVIRVTHTNGGGSAVSTLTLTAQALGPTTGGSASGTIAGSGAQSDAADITHPVLGFGPSAVTFSLTGAGGGTGGVDAGNPGGVGGAGGTLAGSLAVRSGDVLRLHAGGVGGSGASGSSDDKAGAGGGSTSGGYAGGAGGRPGGSGSSGGGAGGGAATVLRRTRAGGDLDVVAPGGGGGGGSGSAARSDLDARAFVAELPSPTTSGEVGQGVAATTDGGGGGGGGGGSRGGGRGDTFAIDVGGRTELFGEGGCRGDVSGSSDDVSVASFGVAGSVAAGTGVVRWHDVTVAHSVTPAEVAPATPVAAAGAAADTGGSTGTLTVALPAAAGDGTHTWQVWNGASDPTISTTPSSSGTATTGALRLTFTSLGLTQSHVVRITQTNGAGSASSTLVLSPQTLTATGSNGSTAGASGGSAGAGAESAQTTLTATTTGFATSAVHFTLTGASGGDGGSDGSSLGGAGGAGQRITGTLGVQDGDRLRVHAGGGGGDGEDSSNGSDGGGGAGGSTISSAYGGGAGGRPGPDGTSGGGGGGGAATVLRRTRGGAQVQRDVVAAGGGGGGGSGNGNPGVGALDHRVFDATDPVSDEGTAGEAGQPKSSGDGGGGGGGGGGVVGGGGGDLFKPDGIDEDFGRGGRRGLTTVSDTDLAVAATTTPGAARAGGYASVLWHSVAVTHSA